MGEKAIKSTPLGAKIWLSAIIFGFVGQLAWVVENMYFATLAQDIFHNSGSDDMSYIVSTLMVIFSAITATVTTIFAGGLCDKLGKRKPFVAYGYIAWGLTIMLFATLPMKVDAGGIALIGFLLVLFDCIMTLAGSTANDAAFNTWVADVTDGTNRGLVNTILSILPVFATVVVFIGLGGLYNKDASSNWLFFVVLGIIPMVAGVLAIFLMKDSPNVIKNTNPNYLKETFYGFRPAVIKENKMMYITLAASCILGISQQTFFTYLVNFVQNTLELGDNFVIPLAVVIVGAAIVTGVLGMLFDKFGRKHFYFPLLVIIVICTLIIYLLEFMGKGAYLPVLYVCGIFMLGSILSLGAALNSSFQDYLPAGTEGRFQGVRMCFSVLIPMIVGPLITLVIGLNNVDTSVVGFAPPFKIFLAAAVVAVLAFIPLVFVYKDSDALRQKMLAKKLEKDAEEKAKNSIVENDVTENGADEIADDVVTDEE